MKTESNNYLVPFDAGCRTGFNWPKPDDDVFGDGGLDPMQLIGIFRLQRSGVLDPEIAAPLTDGEQLLFIFSFETKRGAVHYYATDGEHVYGNVKAKEDGDEYHHTYKLIPPRSKRLCESHLEDFKLYIKRDATEMLGGSPTA